MLPELSQLEWTLDWGPLGLLAAATLGGAGVLLAWRNARGLPIGRRAVLLGLRLGTVLGLLAAILQPTWVELRPRPDDRKVAVLVDASRSMRPGGDDSRARAASVAAAALAARVPTRRFALEPEPRALGDGESAGSAAGSTDLLAALRALGEGSRPAGMTSVVVVSDGRDHGPLGAGEGNTALDDAVLALGVPVHTVAIGDTDRLSDVVVGEVRASRFALARNPLPIEVDLDLGRFAGGSGNLELVLELDGEPMHSERVTLEGSARRSVALELTPTQTGPHVLTVRAVPLPDELTVANNRIHVPIEVVRDRVRVMHLAGRPSPDTRFLRSLLRETENVDLVSFYIMIGRAARVFVDPDDTTLIPFPTTQLFEEALADFDVVIFHDFAFAQYGIDRFVPTRLGPWIERGGAFLSVGGRGSLAAGGYEATSIWPWMPVALDSAGAEAWREQTFTPQRTDIGAAHPITALRSTPQESEAAWAASTLPGHNLRLLPRSGDPVLLQGPDDAPLLAVGQRGKGRVATLATDGTWTWAFPTGAGRSRVDARADYHALWKNLLGWLLRDPAYAELRIRAPREAVAPGTPFEIRVELRGRTRETRAGVEITLSDRPLPDGAPSQWTGRTGPDGVALFTLPAGRSGPHRLQARAEGSVDVPAEAAYAVAEGAPEDLDLRPDPALLGRLARAGGGQSVHDVGELDSDALLGPRDLGHDRVRHELWGHPLVAALLLALLLAEWWLRRRWGLV